MPKQFTQNHVPFSLLLLVVALALASCLKVRVAVDVKPDGSGILGLATGMTQQAKALAASQGGDPMQTLAENLSESPSNPQDVKITRWTEGEYEWVQGEVAFKNLDDLNERMSRMDFFETFSITRQPGLFRDRFILNAHLKPLSDSTNASDSSGLGDIDPSAFIEIQMAVRLPGDVIETNGVFDGKNSSNMLWTVGNKQAITMQATSETWNWLNIGIISGGIGVLVIGGIGLLSIVSLKLVKKSNSPVARTNTNRLPSPSRTNAAFLKKPLKVGQTDAITSVQFTSPTVSPTIPSNLLVTIGARSLLQDVNHFLLRGVGAISETSDELLLEWPVIPGGSAMYSLHIKLVSQHQVTINGQIFPATHEGLKIGIATCLREMSNP